MFISAGWVMVVPITDVVKMTLSVADISVEPIIGTPLQYTINSGRCRSVVWRAPWVIHYCVVQTFGGRNH